MGNTQKVDERKSVGQMVAEKLASINTALVPDENGKIDVDIPIGMDQNSKKMMYTKIPHSKIDVPPDEIVAFMGSVIMDRHNSHSETINYDGQRHLVVFDRSYTHGQRVFNRVAWIPNKAIRSAVVFEKKIDRQTKRPIAVLRKLGQDQSAPPMFQIVGGEEADYRDLKRIFERVFIKKGSPVGEDEELNNFMHGAITPIEQEVSG